MTIQEAINKANEGGYHIYGSDGMDTDYEGANSEYSVWTRKDNESSFIVPTEKTFLDPKFWQALGRALGWMRHVTSRFTCVHGRKRGAGIGGTTGCIVASVLFRHLQTGTPLKPSLPISPPPRGCRAGHGTAPG